MVIISWLKFSFNQCLANMFYHKGMVIHRSKLLLMHITTLLDGVQEIIILHGIHTFLKQHFLEVRDHVLHQDLVIIFLNLTKSFGFYIIT